MIEDSELQPYYVTQLRTTCKRKMPPTINGPEDALPLFEEMVADAMREHFMSMYLSTKNHILGIEVISIGSLSASLVHPREVYKPAILQSAAGILVGHNHPSGNPTPSQEDRTFTNRLNRAGEILGIKLLDHIILGEGDYYSFKEHGDL